mgnify:CR=1 FL=1
MTYFWQNAFIRALGFDQVDLFGFSMGGMIAPKNTVELDRRLPDSQLVVYPDAGHGGVFQFHEDHCALPAQAEQLAKLAFGSLPSGTPHVTAVGRHLALLPLDATMYFGSDADQGLPDSPGVTRGAARDTVVVPTPPLSAPTTITTGFVVMNFPYAPFCCRHDPRANRPSVGGFGSRPCPVPDRKSGRNVPVPCFGREHGRNKGEFNELDDR